MTAENKTTVMWKSYSNLQNVETTQTKENFIIIENRYGKRWVVNKNEFFTDLLVHEENFSKYKLQDPGIE